MSDDEKLKISWDDLSSKQVDEKLEAQDAISSTQSHYQATHIAVPKQQRRLGFLYNTIVYLSLFGALGGLLGWGFGEILHYRTNQQRQAIDLFKEYEEIVRAAEKIQSTPAQIEDRTRRTRLQGARNPYFQILIDNSMTDEQKADATRQQLDIERNKDFIANLLFFGISGVAIAAMLAMADSVIERNLNGAIVHGSIGAVVGAVGGVFVALVVDRIQEEMIPIESMQSLAWRMGTQAICWGLLGLFFAATPGLILRNGKRLLIGALGGVIGGVIGGLLFVPLEEYLGNEHISRLVAITCVGLVAGFACGVIENVVKSGWLKVEAGLIAGKQFVLYRNPTFIGAHPMSHIYLFNDPYVGKRHAAIHIVGNGYEIEDLPLGSRTYINDKEISRQRLRNGDKIRVGGTVFHFQAKAKTV